MTWYDGGEAPDPTRPPHVAARHGAELSGRARLRAAAEAAPDRDPVAAPGVHPTASGLRGAVPGRHGVVSTARAGRAHSHGLRWSVPPRVAALAVLALAVVGGTVALRLAGAPDGPAAPAVTVEEPAVSASAAYGGDPAPTPTPGTVWVHVVGQVGSPGLVGLPEGSRVAEAVAAAGGALPDADLAGLNLAEVVQDGAQVRVPAPGEVAVPAPAGAAAGGAGAADGSPGGAVDVNLADATQLQTLPGIGPVLAERIVGWRTEHGAFASVDDLLDVPGIGPAVLSRIRDQARV
jgi:competence protein ComEA